MPDHVDSVKDYLRLMAGWQADADQKGDTRAGDRGVILPVHFSVDMRN
ncbi:hypothetical protein GCM10007897_44990 [Sphingobium jiangsuense]|nr:hypothetical protein GCM10007897_44990 [Sphingobium jiangsuense]